MIPFINKIITLVLVPVYMCPALPFVHISKLFNLPKDLFSRGEGESKGFNLSLVLGEDTN